MSAVLSDAARVRPPHTGNNNEAALAAATPSAEVDLFATAGPDVMSFWVSLTCTAPFNYLVGETGVVAPSSQEFLTNGTPAQFVATRSKLRFLRVVMPVGGSYKWWISGP